MNSYAHLEKEFRLHKRFNILVGEVVDDVHLNEHGRLYFWDSSIGYTHHDTSIKRMTSHMDLTLINVLRKSLKDIDNSIKIMYNVIESLTRVRMSFPISLNVPIVIASLLTNFFTNIPIVQSTGISSYNIFYVEGDTPCVTERGILNLKSYDSYDDCLMDVSDMFGLSYYEKETFEGFKKHVSFSLTLYRIFFILTLLLKRGVTINGEDLEMDSTGRFRNLGNRRVPVPKKSLFRKTTNIAARPRQAGRED